MGNKLKKSLERNHGEQDEQVTGNKMNESLGANHWEQDQASAVYITVHVDPLQPPKLITSFVQE